MVFPEQQHNCWRRLRPLASVGSTPRRTAPREAAWAGAGAAQCGGVAAAAAGSRSETAPGVDYGGNFNRMKRDGKGKSARDEGALRAWTRRSA